MNDLLTRALSGAVFLAIMISAIWFHRISAVLLFLSISSVGIIEFLKLQLTKVSVPKYVVAIGLNSLLFSGLFTESSFDYKPLLIAVIVLVMCVLSSLFFEKQRAALHSWNAVFFSLFYVTFPFIVLVLLGEKFGDYSFQPILAVFIILWCSDTGAYLFGRFLGKHKLLPKVSPKKTWEGFIGGILMGLLAAFILSLLDWHFGKLPWYYLALLVSILGALGDLFQSQLKRLKGVKDSGNIMPGHGGVLDRFDGLLFSVPVIFALEKLLV